MKMALLILSFFTLQAPLWAADFEGLYADGGWRFVKEKDGFKVYSRRMPGSDILGFKIEGHIDAPVLDIMATLRDIKYAHEWQPDLIEKTSIKNVSDLEAITYSRVDMPWPLDDRDYVIHNKLLVHKKRQLLFVISKTIEYKGFGKVEKAVRAHIGYSNIGLRPVGAKKTYVEWTLFASPKGNIPDWLVNFYQRSFPISFFKLLSERANKRKIKILPGLKQKLAELESVM